MSTSRKSLGRCRGISRRRLLVVCMSVLFMLPGMSAMASSYTVEELAEGMLAAEAQFTDIVVKFVCDIPIYASEGQRKRGVIRGTYARKMPEGWEYRKTCRRTEDRAEPLVDEVAAFDGKVTVWLNQRGDGRGRKEATISPGFKREQFSGYGLDPHHYTWYVNSRISFEELLRREDSEFVIEEVEEDVGGLKTVKVQGTVFKGTASMSLWICPERSFLAIKTRLVFNRNRKRILERSLSDLVQLPNGMWYPKRIEYGKPTLQADAFAYTVEEISVAPLPQEFFRPAIPPNTHVTDHVAQLSYTTQEGDSLGLVDGSLETPVAMGVSDSNGGVQRNYAAAERALEEYVEDAKDQAEKLGENGSEEDILGIADVSDQETGVAMWIIVFVGIAATVVVLAMKRRSWKR